MPTSTCLRRPLRAAIIVAVLAIFLHAPVARAAEGTFSKVEVLSAARGGRSQNGTKDASLV